jgi:hypothetical protein
MSRFLAALLAVCLTATAFAAPLQIVPTTSVAVESNPNTSAPGFAGTANGNLAGANVSKVNVHSLLYADATTKILAHQTAWWGSSGHINIGYRSDDPVQVKAQIADMKSRGFDGTVLSWYGSKHMTNANALLVKAESEAQGFTFAISIEHGSIQWYSCSGCSPTEAVIAHLKYAQQTYFSSPAYLRVNGKPVLLEFGMEMYDIDWAKVRNTFPGIMVIFRNPGGFDRQLSDGAFAWGVANDFSYFDYFYKIAFSKSGLIVGDASKGFDDSAASWSQNRKVAQSCGQTWLTYFQKLNALFSTTRQLPFIQVATWNDYEEGTEVETGINPCTSLTSSVSGATLKWTLTGDESTVDHYTVFISQDASNLMPLVDAKPGTGSLDLSQYELAPGSYSFFVKAISKPMLANAMSGPATYKVTNKPPLAAFNITPIAGTAPLTITVSAHFSDPDGRVTTGTLDFGDGSPTVLPDIPVGHTYGTPGAYTVKLDVGDNLGAHTIVTQTVTVAVPVRSTTISEPANGASVEAPFHLVADAQTNSTFPITAMIVYIDGVRTYRVQGPHIDKWLCAAPGTHRVNVNAWDSTGAVWSKAISITVTQ